MKTPIIQLIGKKEYLRDTAITLFEDEHSFSFGRIELEKVYLKFGWNSKGVEPKSELIKDTSFIFIGIDTYVVGYDYDKCAIVFFLSTSGHFKWFEHINYGLAVVAESEIILLTTTIRCMLRNYYSFDDIIMGSKVENDKIIVSFLSNDDKFISF